MPTSVPIPQLNSMAEYQAAYQASLADPAGFWDQVARHYTWHQPWHTTMQGTLADTNCQWFVGGELNITVNCLDRHLATRGNQLALIWEPALPHQPARTFTYRQLYEQVCQASHALQQLGVKPGDRVGIYLPMIPELAIAVLACARIGAVHSVVFGGFSAHALADRLNDTGAKLLITTDLATRGEKVLAFKEIADQALQEAPGVTTCVVVAHPTLSSSHKVPWQAGRDMWWHQVVAAQPTECLAVPVGAEDPLFVLYTSGSTGKPKGIVHTAGGYMVYAGYSFANVFQVRANSVHWCTADVGWITGHTYLVYGPLLAGVTSVMFEGIPTHPQPDRFWQVIDRHRVTHFYTAPTVIRSLAALPLSWLDHANLSSLQVLGSVGEPINQEAWEWYHLHVGHGRCPIVDTWWQTETGGILISPLAGITPTPATFATLPLPGVKPILLDDHGHPITTPRTSGNLCFAQPWPSMARTIYGNHDRYRETYFSQFPGYYFSGDGAWQDETGNFRITGRVDDTVKVSGHLIGTAEVENSLTTHPQVAEAAVIGIPDQITGTAIAAFVVLHPGANTTATPTSLLPALQQQVATDVGSFAKPKAIYVVPGLPKTRSGKIMRRILKKIVAGELDQLGDTSTLVDPELVEHLIAAYQAETGT